MWAIYKKEIGAFYRSMIGWLYTAFQILISGVFFVAFNLRGGIPEFGYVLGNTVMILLIAVPVLTMRTLAEEKRQRTDQLLFTSPVKVSSIVLGKFLAVLTVFAVPFSVLAFCPAILSLYGEVPLMQSYSCFLAFLVMGAACISIGVFISALTENQILAAVGTFAVLLLSYFMNGIGGLIRNTALDKLFSGLLDYLSLFQRYYDFVEGVFDVSHLVYYVSVTIIFLAFAVFFTERRFSRNLYEPVMCLLAAVIVILSNLIVGRLPIRYTKFDNSSSGLYSLSLQSKEIVESLDTDIALYLIAPKGKEDEKLTRLLDQYGELSSHIRIEYVDPILSPDFVPSYTSDKISDNSILAAGEERFRVLRNSDLYPSNYDYDTGKITNNFDGEGQITSAIRFIASDSLSKIYLVTGHGENELSEELEASLNKEGVSYENINLTVSEEIPEDASCVWLNVPVTDLTKQEAEILGKYLEKGGRMLLLTGITAAETSNLSGILSGYGLGMLQGMVLEGDSNQCIPSYPNFLIPQIRESEITKPFMESGELLLLPNAHAITHLPSVRSTVDLQDLLKTSVRSYLKTDTSELRYQNNDAVGPFVLGATAEEHTVFGKTKIAWFSSSSLLMKEIDEMVGGNNTDLILNTIGWMTEQDNGISIRPKTTASSSLRLSSAQAAVWSVLYAILIPVSILICGVLVCMKRRKQQ